MDGNEEIEDETPKQDQEDKLIEDYYGEDEEIKHEEAGGDDGIDLNYSQTHLDDFLKSQSARGLTTHNSQQLVQSFLNTYNKTKNQTNGSKGIQAIDE